MNSKDYMVNYFAVAERNDNSLSTKLAKKLVDNPYITTSKFIKSLSDKDIDRLIDIGERLREEGILTDQHKADGKEFVLLAVMLKDAEGVELPLNEENAVYLTTKLFTFVAAEKMVREGLCRVLYENMSFDIELDNKPFIQRIV